MTRRHCTARPCSTVRVRGSAPKSAPPGDTKNCPVFWLAGTRFSLKAVAMFGLAKA